MNKSITYDVICEFNARDSLWPLMAKTTRINQALIDIDLPAIMQFPRRVKAALFSLPVDFILDPEDTAALTAALQEAGRTLLDDPEFRVLQITQREEDHAAEEERQPTRREEARREAAGPDGGSVPW